MSTIGPSAIAGAGLTGLVAAHIWPRIPIFESRPRSAPPAHRALLRFRSETVSHVTGIPFRKVTVRKGIWYGGKEVPPSIAVSNLYARKVSPAGVDGDRSIWNVEPAERWVAPPDFYERLVDGVEDRIEWEESVDFGCRAIRHTSAIVSTVPMTVPAATLLGEEIDSIEFSNLFARSEVEVYRYRISGARGLFQTIYYPDPEVGVYRASITDDILTVEIVPRPSEFEEELRMIVGSFGIPWVELYYLDRTSQEFGKIIPLPPEKRKALVLGITQKLGVYSLGRFATWRNILLDDVVKDAEVIRRLLSLSYYERRLFASGD